jgi:predicted RNA binding protein YcfA (HicA-like mRNA interferase family)
MTRLPACRPVDVIRVLRRAGFELHHSRGSHRYFRHPDRPGFVTVPVHPRDLEAGTLLAIPRQTGLSREDFLALL